MFNKTKELKRQIETLTADKNKLIDEIKALQKQLSGNRICGHYCKQCIHGYQEQAYYSGFVSLSWHCVLDCHCPDFLQKKL